MDFVSASRKRLHKGDKSSARGEDFHSRTRAFRLAHLPKKAVPVGLMDVLDAPLSHRG